MLLDVQDWRRWPSATQWPRYGEGISASHGALDASSGSVRPGVRIVVDGSWSPVIGNMGCGTVLRDKQGGWITGLAESFGYWNAYLAKVLAVEMGLKHCSELVIRGWFARQTVWES